MPKLKSWFRNYMGYETSSDSSLVLSKDRLLISSVIVLSYCSLFKADVFLRLCFVKLWEVKPNRSPGLITEESDLIRFSFFAF